MMPVNDMIGKAEIIDQPSSGDLEVRIYDIQSQWNSPDWTWVKFTDDDFSEWCGNFRGSPRQVGMSQKHDIVLVLTSDYLFLLDKKNADIVEIEDQPRYQQLIETPHGDFLLADYHSIELMCDSLKSKRPIPSPVAIDEIKFARWNNHALEFTCTELLDGDRPMTMELDIDSLTIALKKGT